MRWMRTDRFPIGGNPGVREWCQLGGRVLKRFEFVGEALVSETTKIVFRWYCHLYKLPHRLDSGGKRASIRLQPGRRSFLFNYGCNYHPHRTIPDLSEDMSE